MRRRHSLPVLPAARLSPCGMRLSCQSYCTMRGYCIGVLTGCACACRGEGYVYSAKIVGIAGEFLYGYFFVAECIFRPALRLEPKSSSSSIGKFCWSSTRRNSCPTAPLAPTMATFIWFKYFIVILLCKS